jgi:hypothetical protein
MPKALESKSSAAALGSTSKFSPRFPPGNVVHKGASTPSKGVTKSVQSDPNELLDFDKANKINDLEKMPKSWAAISLAENFPVKTAPLPIHPQSCPQLWRKRPA